jgi:DNA-directed RNA polymerase subunit F
MIGKGKADSRLATIPQVLEILDARQEAGGELGYEQELTHTYAKMFAKIDAKEAEKMKKEIVELGISEKTAVKIIEIMPSDIIQLRQTVIIEKKSVDEEILLKVMEVVSRYRGK